MLYSCLALVLIDTQSCKMDDWGARRCQTLQDWSVRRPLKSGSKPSCTVQLLKHPYEEIFTAMLFLHRLMRGWRLWRSCGKSTSLSQPKSRRCISSTCFPASTSLGWGLQLYLSAPAKAVISWICCSRSLAFRVSLCIPTRLRAGDLQH